MNDNYDDRIICGDSLEYMRQMPDRYFDLVITDPPYGINITKKGKLGGGSTFHFPKTETWDRQRPSKKYFDEMRRVSKNQIIFGWNYFTDYLPPTRCYVVWDKGGGFKNTVFADCELAYTSFDAVAETFCYDPLAQGAYHNKRHPTQKPDVVLRFLLYRFSKENDRILDPFGGGLSTAIACKETNRRFCCIEQKQEYIDRGIEVLNHTQEFIL